MTELSTATDLDVYADDVELPVRKAAGGFFKSTFGGIKTFFGLPDLASGTAGQALLLNATEDAYEFGDAAGVPEAPIDGDTYGRKDGAWEVVGGGGGLPAFSGATVIRGAAAAQTNGANAYVRIIYGTEVIDVGGWFDSAVNNGRLVVPAGVSYVQLGAQTDRSGSTGGDVQPQIRKNGGGIFSMAYGSLFFGFSVIQTQPIAVVPGDYFEFWVRAQSAQSWDGSMTFWIRALG